MSRLRTMASEKLIERPRRPVPRERGSRRRSPRQLQREIAFLEERLRFVEQRKRDCCEAMAQSHPEVRERIWQQCQCPFGEERTLSELLPGADAALLRYKREEYWLRCLREDVERFPLTTLLWKGPMWLTRMDDLWEDDNCPCGTCAGERRDAQLSAATLRFLCGLWWKWNRTR